jgi:hypothetical protein
MKPASQLVLPSRSEILRSLASEARQSLRNGRIERNQLQTLLHRIEAVRGEMSVAAPTPVSRWLDSLRRELVEAAEPRPATN